MGQHVYVDKVTDDLYILRVDDINVNYFEALWEIPEKISYNSYLLFRRDHIVLFDGWKADYAELFLETLRKIVDPRDISEVIVHHLEPDHSGSIPKLLEVNHKAVFYGHPLVGKMLSSFYRVSRFKPLQDGAVLDVGTSLKFIHTPWLHWPETSMSYLDGEGVLLTCDAFGSYGLQPLFDDNVNLNELEHEIRKYFVTVIGHYAPHVLKAVKKLRDLGVTPRIIAPGHGTVLRNHVDWTLSIYTRLGEGASVEKATLVYVSMYGNVESSINRLKEELKGLNVEVYSFTDKARANISDVLSSMADSRLVILGAATYEAEIQPLMRYLVDLIGEKLSYRKDLRFLVMSPYGWSGVAGKKIAEKLKSYGFTNVEVVEWEGAFTDSVLEKASKTLEQLIL